MTRSYSSCDSPSGCRRGRATLKYHDPKNKAGKQASTRKAFSRRHALEGLVYSYIVKIANFNKFGL